MFKNVKVSDQFKLYANLQIIDVRARLKADADIQLMDAGTLLKSDAEMHLPEAGVQFCEWQWHYGPGFDAYEARICRKWR